MARTLHISLADIHYPKWDRATIAAALDFIARNKKKIKSVGFQGDAFDNEAIAHHNSGRPLYKTRGAYVLARRGFERDVLTPLEKVLDPATLKWYILGNHERFEYDFIETHPELDGLLSNVDALRMVERGWEIIPLGHSKKIGHLDVIHGEVLTGIGNQAGMYPSRKAVELYAGNVLAAHTHAPQSFTRVSPVDARRKYMGWIAPICGAINPGYLRNRPTAWVNGFTIIEEHLNGKNFNLYPVIVTEGSFSFGGEIYGKQPRKK